ncbi:sulfatase-like hydrolase/transferase [Planctomycetota bacterium]
MNALNKTLYTLMVAVLWSAPLITGAYAKSLEVSPPNFIVILTDDQGWAGTNVPMDATVEKSSSPFFITPQLGRLADMGVRFSQGYSSAPKCAPARAGLLTGQTPARLRYTENGNGRNQVSHSKKVNGTVICPNGKDDLSKDAMTIGEWFKQNAPHYTTAHFGKWHVGRPGNGPADRGFDVSDGPTGNADGNIRDSNPVNFPPDDPKWVFTLSNRANAFMKDQVTKRKPFYLQISHYAVHLKEYASPSTTAEVNSRGDTPKGLNPVYVAMTQDLDTAVGKVLDEVKELGIDDTTYIFYISDNGGEREIANGPLAKKKRWNWEGGIRVPFVVSGPGIPKGQISKVPAVGFDIFPTICDLTGHGDKIPNDVDGGSLKDVLFNPTSGQIKRDFPGLFFHVGRYFKTYFVTPHSALILGDYKFIIEYDSKDKTGSHRWLYNLKEDIGEKNNLVTSMPEKAREMERQLMTHLKDVAAEIPTTNPDYRGPNPYVPIESLP